LAEVLHVCGPSRVFSDVHAAGKNGFDFFRACGRELRLAKSRRKAAGCSLASRLRPQICETALADAFCAALRAVARFASQCGKFAMIR
jgi:hypothetical protein